MDSAPKFGTATATLDVGGDGVVDLCAALSMRFAEMAHCRVLIIKGASLVHHGLRLTHMSADVDILVEPTGAEVFLSAALTAGWRPRQTTSGGARLRSHSVTVTNENWPIDIDVHAAFPGILAEPGDAFEALWQGKTAVNLAGVRCWVPSKEASVIIWALHCLRGTAIQARHAEELEHIVNVVVPSLTHAERAALAGCAVELAADEPLRAVPAFAQLLGSLRGSQVPGSYEEWLRKVAQVKDSSFWVQVFREAKPKDLPRLLVASLWPPAADLRLIDERLVDTPLGRVQSRGRRAWRLVRRIVARRRQAH